MLRDHLRSTRVSTVQLSRALAAFACLAVVMACGEGPTGAPETSPLMDHQAAFAAGIAVEDARDRLLPTLSERAHADALRSPLAALRATLAANDARGAQVALDRVRPLLVSSRGGTTADVELSALELAVDGAAAVIPPR